MALNQSTPANVGTQMTEPGKADDKDKDQGKGKVEIEEFPLTAEGQLKRLTRPGSKYFNLNPFEVLSVGFSVTEIEIKKQYRRLARLVHPDKNPNNKDDATTAFDAVNHAFQRLSNPVDFEVAKQCAAAAREQVEADFKKQRAAAKKKEKDKGKGKGKDKEAPSLPEEGTPEYDRILRLHTCKVFAEREEQMKETQEREAAELKRVKEQEMAYDDALKKRKKEREQWEKGRDERVEGWRVFSDNKSRKKARYGVRPPKMKVEERANPAKVSVREGGRMGGAW